MGNSIFGIATSGLNAAQAGLLTTSHNIANVNTAGFSRQEVVQATGAPAFTGAGYFGSGVSIATVRRAYGEFLELQVRDTQAQAAAADKLNRQLAAVDDLLGDPSVGLGPALNDFFQGAHALAAQPSDPAARQAMLARGEALAARFRDLDAQLRGMQRAANLEIETVATAVSAIAPRVAEINRRILEAEAHSTRMRPANDLLDQREALLVALNREIGATAIGQEDGTVNVFLASGQALVIGTTGFTMTTLPDPESPGDLALGVRVGATVQRLRAGEVGGGRVAGLLEFRDGDLAQARNALGRIAIALAADFNAQHRLGQDRAGMPGGDFFAAGTPIATARASNGGNAQIAVTVADLAALTTSDYRVLWDGTDWQVRRLADGATQSFGTLPQTVDGLAIALASGTPAAGDSFRISPAGSGAANFALLVRDGNRIAAAAPIRTAPAAGNTGSGRISAGSVNAPPPPDPNLQQTVTLTFTSSGTFDVSGLGTGNPTGLAYTPGAAISFNGWSITLDGAPAAGDRFTVSANTGGLSDNRNVLALAGLQTRRGLEGGSATYGDAYAGLVGTVGNRAHATRISAEAQAKLADQAQEKLQSLAGVNLDEEAANLLRYQQAYQAAGKAFAVANVMFDTVLRIG
jgi:flagellar hook-associated protein 1 FlgK